MRHRIVRVAVGAATTALVLFAIPLAIAVQAILFSEERGELQRAALEAAGRVGPQFAAGDRAELPAFPEGDTLVGVYDLHLRLRAGRGPASADALTSSAAHGKVADGRSDAMLVVAVPVTSAERVLGVARASAPIRRVWERVLLTWLTLAGLAVAALVAAIVVARQQARLLSHPLEALSDAARRVAEGDLDVRASPSDVAEIRQVARAQDTMVTRLTGLLERERHFSADASHQLRTPLTGLRLALQTALQRRHHDPDIDLRPTLEEAVVRVDELNHTVEDILRMARLTPTRRLGDAPEPLRTVLDALEIRWHGALARDGRRLAIHADGDEVQLRVPGAAVAQVLDVLLDNAVRHGLGAVTVSVREIVDMVAIDVSDEGSTTVDARAMFDRGTSSAGGQGIGLALARSLAEASGGRLNLTSAAPTRFGLLIPPL